MKNIFNKLMKKLTTITVIAKSPELKGTQIILKSH